MNFSRTDFRLKDVLAGLALAAIGIPEVMGYTKIIGTPVVTGLYTMIFPAIAFAFFGSSKRLVVGADSATAAIVASTLIGVAAPMTTDYVALTSLIALSAGVMLLLARVLRLGFLANFLSQTVLAGFLTGVGFQVMLGQLPSMLDINPPQGKGLERLSEFAAQIFHLHFPSVLTAFSTLVFIGVSRRATKKIPAPLIALVIAIAASAYFDLAQFGLKMVGDVPSGFPPFSMPSVLTFPGRVVLSIAFSCFIVILAQSAATSSAYAFGYQDDFDEDRDLVGLGLANIVASLTGAFVVNGSPTRTAIVDEAGGRTQVAQLTAALAAVVVLLFLTKPLAYLPNAVLSAVVFVIGAHLIDRRGLSEIFNQSKMEFWLAVATCLTVLILGVEEGILLSVLLSLLYHVRRSYRPKTDVLVKDELGNWRSRAQLSDPQDIPGVLVYWFGADLFYANVGHFLSEIQELLRRPIAGGGRLQLLIIDAGAITGIDYSAARRVDRLKTQLSEQNIRLAWAHVSKGLRNDMKRHLILDEGTLYETLREVLNSERQS